MTGDAGSTSRPETLADTQHRSCKVCARVCRCVGIGVCACVRACVCVQCMHACMYACMHVRMLYACLRVCMCACVYASMFIMSVMSVYMFQSFHT